MYSCYLSGALGASANTITGGGFAAQPAFAVVVSIFLDTETAETTGPDLVAGIGFEIARMVECSWATGETMRAALAPRSRESLRGANRESISAG